MKPKPNTLFVNKLSGCLSKLRDASTIEIGHEQFRQLLQNTQLKDVIGPFISKLDTLDRPSDREKKQHSKVDLCLMKNKMYITLIDHFGEEVLLQYHYEKLMESLVKKTVGVADVIGYLCKGYISRIHPLQNTKNYIIYILTLFKQHIEIHKIIKQIAQTINPIIVASLQTDMINMIVDKMQNSRQKAQYIEAMMGVLLTLEDKFQCENILQPVLMKNLKNEDWNVRKACVDICYTFMVVKQEINTVLHELVKELKYDKIKNVRDSVVNYESLYKQVYGEEESFKPQNHSQKTSRINIQRTPKSPQIKDKLKSEDEQKLSQIKTPGKVRNEKFFKNAKDSDVIRVGEQPSNNLSEFNIKGNKSQNFPQVQQEDNGPQIKLRQNKSMYMPSSNTNVNFYIKSNARPNLLTEQSNTVKRDKSANNLSSKFHNNFDGMKDIDNLNENKKHEDLNKFGKKEMKILTYDNEIDDGMKKSNEFSIESEEIERRQYMPIKKSEIGNHSQKIHQLPLIPSTHTSIQTTAIKPHNHESISLGKLPSNYHQKTNNFEANSVLKLEMSQIKAMFDKFQQRIMSRIDRLQDRVQSLEQSHLKLSFGKEAPFEANKNLLQNLQDSAISLKNDHFYPYEETNLFKKTQPIKGKLQIEEDTWPLYSESQTQQAVESNLLQKVNEALRNHNIDEAFSVALANNKVPLLMKLLQSLHIPTDKTVEQCLLLEIKKQVSRKEALKWLKNYLVEKLPLIKNTSGGSIQKMLIKIRTELIKQNNRKEKDYDLLKTIVLNQMEEIFQSNK